MARRPLPARRTIAAAIFDLQYTSFAGGLDAGRPLCRRPCRTASALDPLILGERHVRWFAVPICVAAPVVLGPDQIAARRLQHCRAGRSPNPRCWPERTGLGGYGSVPGRARRQGQGTGQGNRVSLLRLPRSIRRACALPLVVRFPGGVARDLEAASPIPRAAACFLPKAARRAAPRGCLSPGWRTGPWSSTGCCPWPVPVDNVEAIEVGRVGGRLVLLFAERGRGQDRTALRWASSPRPPAFGAFRTVDWPAVDPVGPRARPVSALTLDRAGRIYVASTHDPDESGRSRRGLAHRRARRGPGRRTAGAAGRIGARRHPGRLQGRGLAVRPTPEGANSCSSAPTTSATAASCGRCRSRLNPFPAGARPCPTWPTLGLFIAAATCWWSCPGRIRAHRRPQPRAGTAAGLVSCLGVLPPPWCT